MSKLSGAFSRDDDAIGSAYRWEQGMARSWDAVKEDELGNIVTAIENDRERAYRSKKNGAAQSIRRGLIRYVVVLLDCSDSALERDGRFSRFETIKSSTERFISEFYDQNPISQLSIALTRDRVAEKLTDLSGNSKSHIHALKQVLRANGSASLQNSLVLAMTMLKHIPDYGNREMIIIYASLGTCDPGDIFSTIDEAKKMKIRCSVICFGAEIYICRKLAEITGGTFAVAMDANHLSELLLRQTTPPADLQDREDVMSTDFVYMGFPRKSFDPSPVFAYEGRGVRLTTTCYVCPRCNTRTTEIPTVCCVCNLQLNSSSHIARSHHHLFPVPNYIEVVPVSNNNTSLNPSSCTGCMDLLLPGNLQLQCPDCLSLFCLECDMFIHDTLHNCPGCS